MHHLNRLLLVSLLFTVSLLAEDKPAAAPAEDAPKTLQEAYARKGIKTLKGPAVAHLGKKAEFKLPEGFLFVGEDALDRFYQLTQNTRSGNELGVVIAPSGWLMFFDYDDVGYVKDDERNKLDAEALMKSMKEGEESSNEDRKAKGYDQLRLAGWAMAPHYDQKTNNLKWAINITSSEDGFKSVFLNEKIKLLGRGGVMNVILVTDPESFKTEEAEADQLLAQNFTYLAGEKYAEFKPGDKIAEYGLAALVLGGGAAVAAKMGLFSKFGVLLAKMGKAVILVFVAIAAGIKKLFDRITGARPKDDSSA